MKNYAKVFASFRGNNIELILKFNPVEVELIKQYIAANFNDARTGINAYLGDICHPMTIVDFFAVLGEIKVGWENPDSLSKLKKKNVIWYTN